MNGSAKSAKARVDFRFDQRLSGLRRSIFGIDEREVLVGTRGFDVNDATKAERIESIGKNFVSGYHAALQFGDDEYALAHELEHVGSEVSGFAFEGAAMALTLLDFVSLWKRDRFKRFIQGPGKKHIYMAYVGAGWAMARVPGASVCGLRNMDPLLRWLSIDGLGFHDGYFNAGKSIRRQKIPITLTGYKARVFDQGLGRSLWFVKGANVETVARTIMSFPKSRRSDLWAGVGLAATYAGIVSRAQLIQLRELSRPWESSLAQGSAFAIKTRLHAGVCPPHSVLACEILCQSDVKTAADVTDEALERLTATKNQPAYETWRLRIQEHYRRSCQ